MNAVRYHSQKVDQFGLAPAGCIGPPHATCYEILFIAEREQEKVILRHWDTLRRLGGIKPSFNTVIQRGRHGSPLRRRSYTRHAASPLGA
jgi:hypothetical protein